MPATLAGLLRAAETDAVVFLAEGQWFWLSRRATFRAPLHRNCRCR